MRSLMILSGRLAADPTSKVLEESQKLVSNVTIFLDPMYIQRDKAAPIQVSAWEEEMAKELCKYKKGDMLHVVANVRPGQYKISEEKTIDIPGATIRAFISENQAQDLKRGVLEALKAMDCACIDILSPAAENNADEDRIVL